MCWLEWALCMQSVCVKLTVLGKPYDMTIKWQLIMTFIQNCTWCTTHKLPWRLWSVTKEMTYQKYRTDIGKQPKTVQPKESGWLPTDQCCKQLHNLVATISSLVLLLHHSTALTRERKNTWFCESSEKYSSLVQDSVKEKAFIGVTFLNLRLLEDHYAQNYITSHVSSAVISDCYRHDTVAIHMYQSKLLSFLTGTS
jgi:hypothetical protein